LIAPPAMLFACGGDDNANQPAPTPDAGDTHDASVPDTSDASPAIDAADTGVDTGHDSSLPALRPWERFPQVDYLGGALLTSIKVVTITFAGDDPTLVSHLQSFGDTITQTAWWTATTSEYCVEPAGTPCIGPGSSGGHVVVATAAPNNLTDTLDGNGSTLVQWIQARIDDGTFPAPDPQQIYQIYFPNGITLHFDGSQSCSSWGAYHYSASFTPKGGGTPVEAPYAIEPRCSGESYTTFAASHELIEAATDAHPGKDLGYSMQDPGLLFYGNEVGDLCDLPWNFLSMNESGFNVQRGWSNKSGRTGHNPCVIQPNGEVYFNVAPAAGYEHVYLSPGESVTFDVEAYADGSTADWNISAQDVSDRLGEAKTLSFSFDKSTINAGQTAKLTVTLGGAPQLGLASYVIHSQNGSGHWWWGAEVRLK